MARTLPEPCCPQPVRARGRPCEHRHHADRGRAPRVRIRTAAARRRAGPQGPLPAPGADRRPAAQAHVADRHRHHGRRSAGVGLVGQPYLALAGRAAAQHESAVRARAGRPAVRRAAARSPNWSASSCCAAAWRRCRWPRTANSPAHVLHLAGRLARRGGDRRGRAGLRPDRPPAARPGPGHVHRHRGGPGVRHRGRADPADGPHAGRALVHGAADDLAWLQPHRREPGGSVADGKRIQHGTAACLAAGHQRSRAGRGDRARHHRVRR